MNTEAKRTLIERLKENYTVSDLCQWLDCPCSCYYAPPKNKNETHGLESVEQILLRFPFYGYRQLHKALLRQGSVIGEHRVRRLLRQLEITRSVGKVHVQTTDSHRPHPRYPNRVKGAQAHSPRSDAHGIRRRMSITLSIGASTMPTSSCNTG